MQILPTHWRNERYLALIFFTTLLTTVPVFRTSYPNLTESSPLMAKHWLGVLADDNNSFNKYILPSKPTSPSAFQVTGLTLCGNVMYYHETPVDAMSLHESLTLFLSCLDEMKPCILVGHKFAKFDFPRLLRAFESCKLLNYRYLTFVQKEVPKPWVLFTAKYCL